MDARVILNRTLAATGVEVRLKPSPLIRSPHELRMTVEFAAAHLATRRPGSSVTVLQIGAFDGTANDPISDAIERFGWDAILVEPQADAFAALTILHQDNANVQLINAAVADVDGRKDLFDVEPSGDLPAWIAQIASFDRSHLVRQSRHLKGIDFEDRIRRTQVDCVTIDSLLARAGSPRIDVLQIDTEGYDLEVLRMFDVARRLPAIINYEHEHLSRAEREYAVRLLVKSGYRVAMVSGGFDTLGYRLPES